VVADGGAAPSDQLPAQHPDLGGGAGAGRVSADEMLHWEGWDGAPNDGAIESHEE
jgi:hypothetical protein